MGILDVQNMFSDAQVVAANGNSTNVVDTGASRNLGAGERNYFQLDAVATAGDAATTIQAKLVGADDAAFAVNKITILDTGALAFAVNNVNKKFASSMRSHLPKRFYRVEYTIAGGGGPSLTITAEFVKDIPTTPEVVFF